MSQQRRAVREHFGLATARNPLASLSGCGKKRCCNRSWITCYRTRSRRKRTRSAAFGYAATLAILATFCVGLGVAGTPSKQRHIEADRKRIEDLRMIGQAVKLWRDDELRKNANATIPPALADLKSRPRPAPRMTDPETGANYEYHPKAAAEYELCANFAAEDRAEAQRADALNFWTHGKGRGCFVLDASAAVPY